ncbi:MAG: hypothetical protein NT154_16440, partial [Verrucomicrobia bacterium]|nr:hypothetical protein [Verrucomicrobiota bacterium]
MGQILSAQTTILSEGFEGTFPGIWLVGDDNAAGTPAYWKDVNASFGGEATHSGSWKGYCAGFGYAGDAANPTYQNSMAAYMQTTLDLRGYVSATLKFWSKIPSIESCCDGARVFIDGILVWFSSSPQAAWGEETFDLTSYVGGVHTLRFEFDSDGSGTYKGWYLDDISVTGIPAPSNDECAGAITLLPDVPFVMSTVEATSVNDPAPTCQPNFGKGVWFTYRPSSSGKMIVSTCGSSFDTVLQVYHGTCRVLTPVAGG